MSEGEPEPVTPKLLPEQRIGAAMRRARERAGVSLRQMAKQLGYHSHTTLSAYERGAVMPTDEAVQSYERVLGLEPSTLLDVLESARIDRHGDAWPKRRVHLQLRSSARCGTSWGRFVPTTALAKKPSLELEIDVYRPADGAAAKFHVAYDGLPAYGNMLISKHECVYAQLRLIRHGRPSLPPVQTACR